MSITVGTRSPVRPMGGKSGLCEQYFDCSWDGTDVTGTIETQMVDVKRIKSIVFLAEPATDEVMYFGGTLNEDLSIVLEAGGLLTLGRVALAPTSDLAFTIGIEGFR